MSAAANGDLRALTLVPAIDLRGGSCVRLSQGDPNRETRYESDPVKQARAFVAAGALRLHVVDLDGAFGTGENMTALAEICRAIDIPVQTGGGIRTHADVAARLDAGAQAVIVGTLLIEQPILARALVVEYGARIIAGIDARGSQVAVRGWLNDGGRDRDELLRELREWGLERVIFTEIARDGMGTGYDLRALATVAEVSCMRVTASGGAHSLADLEALARETPVGVDHAIIGRALYEGTIDLRAALARFSAPDGNAEA
jgi:phosphoribosylformimino-5-aminoimidazole carboxamide ribotide isomerase